MITTGRREKCATQILVAWSSLESFHFINVNHNTEILVTYAELQLMPSEISTCFSDNLNKIILRYQNLTEIEV